MQFLSKKYYYIQYIWYLIILCCAFSIGSIYYFVHNSGTYFSPLQSTHHQDSVLLDDEGVVWARFQADHRGNISLLNMPKHLIQAFIATEDRQFYDHIGISRYGIARSLIHNVIYRRAAQGASTITQQLVRLLLGDTKKNPTEKIKRTATCIGY